MYLMEGEVIGLIVTDLKGVPPNLAYKYANVQ